MESNKNSNLRARDFSIITCGPLPCVKTVVMGVQASSSSTCIEENENHIQVYLRIKKVDTLQTLYDVHNYNTLICKPPEGASCMRNIRDGEKMIKIFKFSKIFGPDANQGDIFNNVVKSKVLNFINGSNCNLLTYGASASGKTYTIVGTPDQPGLIPRALEYLFRTLQPLPEVPHVKPTAPGGTIHLTDSQKQKEKNIGHTLLSTSVFNTYRTQHIQTYKIMQQRLSSEPVAELLNDTTNMSLGVWVSFAEIYNEWIHDLLMPEPTRGQQRKKLALGYCNGDAYIKDLTSIYVKSSLQAYQILQYGLHKLKYATTSLNNHSSRSHFIFTLKLVSPSSMQNFYTVNTFTFCDLAGLERIKKTQNFGIRLNESTKINASLTVLGRCIELIRKTKGSSSRIIPFRESKLTQLLQKALLGHEAISMIININPAGDMFNETQHVLHFSAIAKDVNIEQQPTTTRFSEYIENESPVSPIISKEESKNSTAELQLRIAELVTEIEQEKVNNREEREYIMATYKNHLNEVHEYWENRCKKLEQVIDNDRQITLAELNRRINQGEVTVISLDNSLSSDEENNNEADFNKKTLNNSKASFTDLQRELMELRRQLDLTDSEINQLLADKNVLENIIEDNKIARENLEINYKAASKSLKNQAENQQTILNSLSFRYENLSIWSDEL